MKRISYPRILMPWARKKSNLTEIITKLLVSRADHAEELLSPKKSSIRRTLD